MIKKPTKKKPAKKPTKKPTKKPVPQGPLVGAWAVKNSKKCVAFMPDEVAVLLEGSATPTALLFVTGWSSCHDADELWPKGRLERSLERIKMDWAEEFGKGWKIEVRQGCAA